MHEKDPFGDKLKDKERGEEEQYFANRERALLNKLRRVEEAGREATPSETAPGRCAKCGGLLTTSTPEGNAVPTCPSCQGVTHDQRAETSVSRRQGDRWLARLLPHSLVGTR